MGSARAERLPDGGEIAYTEFEPRPEILVDFFEQIFLRHWREVTFGPCIAGAVYEIRLTAPPKAVHYKDCYLTVDTGDWHCHLCLDGKIPDRRPSRAAFFESKNRTCVPMSFGFRMWNGSGEQMISIFFPNPYLNDDSQTLAKPDWTRLTLWKAMKAKYTGDHTLCFVSGSDEQRPSVS
jgi:hypothetical protein